LPVTGQEDVAEAQRKARTGKIPGFSRRNREFREFDPCNRLLAAKTVSQINRLRVNSRNSPNREFAEPNRELNAPNRE
jgi:hypothetical protein